MTDRELMQQALEALTTYDGTNGESKRKRVLAALRERLAQPEQEIVECSCPAKDMPFGRCCKASKIIAWINYNAATGRETIDRDCHSELASTPLYTIPPQRPWVGLTDDELESMAEQYVTDCYFDTLKYGQAIQLKIKERNG